MRLRTLGAVCATCAATAPSSVLSTDLAAAAAPTAAPAADATAPPPAADATAPPTQDPAAAPPPPIGAVTAPPSLAATPAVPATSSSGHSVVKTRLVERNVFLKQRYERLRGGRLTRSERRHRREILHRLTTYHVRVKNLHLSRDIRELRALLTPDIPIQLEAIARCESGGDPHAVSASGTYRGKYQFSFATWSTVGGRGDPAEAPEPEQDHRAAMLYHRHGPGQWPVCGR